MGQGNQGNRRIFEKRQEKVRKENFYSCNFSTLIKKSFAPRYKCHWVVYYNQFYIWCYYFHLVLRWFNSINHFYFNLSEVVFHLDQERKLTSNIIHTIMLIIFFWGNFQLLYEWKCYYSCFTTLTVPFIGLVATTIPLQLLSNAYMVSICRNIVKQRNAGKSYLR